ncbi:MAG: carboxypeptidase-like regulatory domain-containing protein, partial [Candidatus Poribacteria bacterium]|nr:carboxypeptidase-like regulatory domain-containing protein [Candidatus Poribacteria bacterium]
MKLKKYNALKSVSHKFRKLASFTKVAFSLLVAVCMAVAVNFDVSAAITGKVSGVITAEATNAPLADVTVTLVGTSTTTTTNDAGYYVMTNIPPRNYDVKVEITGYAAETVAETKVLAGLTTTLDFTLKSAAVQLEGITVTAVKPLIKKDVTQSTRIIESDDIEAMPRDTVN